jgi:hypothetical protein
MMFPLALPQPTVADRFVRRVRVVVEVVAAATVTARIGSGCRPGTVEDGVATEIHPRRLFRRGVLAEIAQGEEATTTSALLRRSGPDEETTIEEEANATITVVVVVVVVVENRTGVDHPIVVTVAAVDPIIASRRTIIRRRITIRRRPWRPNDCPTAASFCRDGLPPPTGANQPHRHPHHRSRMYPSIKTSPTVKGMQNPTRKTATRRTRLK